MDYKLEFITRLFQKTSKKKIEHYVLTRLWHKLDNYDIKMVPQQYVFRTVNDYALTDVFFPQFKLHVEVNEPAHYKDNERIERDIKRNNQIKRNTSHEIRIIDCRENIEGIHKQIDNVVNLITNKLNDQKNDDTFKPWDPDKEFSFEYWKKQGMISANNDINFRTIDDICMLFDVDPNRIKRGYLRKGGIAHPNSNNIHLWWPSTKKRSGWINKYDDNTGDIFESHQNPDKNKEHLENIINTDQSRIIFLQNKDMLGLKSYKFLGVYQLDQDESSQKQKLVWKRVSLTFNLDELTW